MSLLAKLLRIPHQQTPISQELTAHQLGRAYQRCFLGADGKLHSDAQIVLADLTKQGGLIHSIPVRKLDGSLSVEDTLINEGKRLIVLGIYRRIYRKTSLTEGLTPEEETEIIDNIIEEVQET